LSWSWSLDGDGDGDGDGVPRVARLLTDRSTVGRTSPPPTTLTTTLTPRSTKARS
jgi:hypothetical protein